MRFLAVFLLGLAAVPGFSWNGQIDAESSQNEATLPGVAVQTDFGRFLAQGMVSDQEAPFSFLQTNLTVWGSWDTLPSGNPSALPDNKGQASSRLLEGYATWNPFPGRFQLQLGKILLSPSSGFFRTPLDFFVHPAVAPSLDGASQGPWQEGYWGENTQLFWDGGSVQLWLSPKLTWSDAVDGFLKYVSLPQNFWRSQLRIGWRLGDADFQILAEGETPEGLTDSAATLRYGAGVDAAVNDAWTLKAEGRVDTSMTTGPQTQGLAGFAWSPGERTSVTVEVATDPTGLHGFVRWALPLDDKVDGVLYAIPSLEDESGIAGGELKGQYDSWGWTAWAELPWGKLGTEQGNSPWRGTWGAKASLYF